MESTIVVPAKVVVDQRLPRRPLVDRNAVHIVPKHAVRNRCGGPRHRPNFSQRDGIGVEWHGHKIWASGCVEIAHPT